MPKPLATLVRPGEPFRLDDVPTDERGPYDGKDDPQVAADLSAHLTELAELQQRLLAEQTRSVLVVLQAMDAAGKDGVLRKVVGPLDSRGTYVWSFKAPAGEELAHDYLWRVHARAPRKGELTFFNRSHYEDVLVVRVLDLVPRERWSRRYEHIRAFEKALVEEGTTIVKIYLHISRDEQRRRFEERLADPAKHWKFDPRDLEMRARWDAFREAYEEAFEQTSTPWAPWNVVPADRKWFRDLAVSQLLVSTLRSLDPQYPAAHWEGITIP